jgi:hypothetical protein
MPAPVVKDLIVYEGYFDVTETHETTDCDHGPCTGRSVPELGMVFYTYAEKPNMISFHDLSDHFTVEEDPTAELVRPYLTDMAARGDGDAAQLLKLL